MQVLSIRENPELRDKTIAYIQSKWANENSEMVYEDCIAHCIDSEAPLPQWYLLMENHKIAGCSG